MEINPYLIGPLSLISGFSGADRLLVGEYKGAALKVLLFVVTATLMVIPARSAEDFAKLWRPAQALMSFLLGWWLYDALTVFSKMYDPAPSNTLFGIGVRWEGTTSTRTHMAYMLLFVLLFVILALV